MTRLPVTIREAYLQASSFLEQYGVQESRHIAELLLSHLLGWNRTEWLLRWEEPLPSALEEQWRQMLSRKASGEPAQYITGEQEFYGLPFRVNPAVLIPRPETELLVEAIMERGRAMWPGGSPALADIGTGSGAIPVTIAVHCPDWRIAASDISEAALETAKQNAELLRVRERIAFYCGDLLEPLIQAGEAVDILVSNPPYIPSGDLAGLQREVGRFEPRSALDGGEDGLAFYRRFMEQVDRLPRVPALAGFEVGQGQAEDVAAMMRRKGCWDDIAIIPDLAGIERHVIGAHRRLY